MTSHSSIPTSIAIVQEAAKELGLGSLGPEAVRADFDSLLRTLSAKTLSIYEQYEEEFYSTSIAKRAVEGNEDLVEKAANISETEGFEAGVLALLQSLYPSLRGAFLSVRQGRMSRGGKSFEDQFALLLEHGGYSFARQHKKYRTDFMLPSEDAFDKNRVVCVVASLKRTLRERWLEVVGELTQLHAPNVYLITADENVSPGHVKGICDDNPLNLVTWDDVKKKYDDHPRVLGFTQFASERLPQLESQWTNAGLS